MIHGLRHSGMKSEHGQTMIRVLKTIYAQRLWELARQVVPIRAQEVKTLGMESRARGKWIDHADEVLMDAQAEERFSEQRRRTHAT